MLEPRLDDVKISVPWSGGIIYINGTNFGADLSQTAVNINYYGIEFALCRTIQMTIPHSQIRCEVIWGFGMDLMIQIKVGGQWPFWGQPARLTYEPGNPAIPVILTL